MNATEQPYQTITAQRTVESASASTLPQTNSSRFAYILTASVLGLISLLALAITLLIYTAFSTYYFSTDVLRYLYEEDDQDAWGPQWDEDDFDDGYGFMSDTAKNL